MEEKDWRIRPKILHYWPEGTDIIMGIDENGTAEIKNIVKKIRNDQEINDNDKYFTLTGVSFNQAGYSVLKEKMNEIKFRHWNEGLYQYKDNLKRVCFHSTDIRNKNAPFFGINHSNFQDEISELMNCLPTKVISCFFNKEAHCRKYIYPDHPYDLAMKFLLERYCGKLNDTNKKGAIIIEGRGKPEDKAMLKHILNIIKDGTSKNPSSHFECITGVYFNPKWSHVEKNMASFVILELADLMSYPIHKHFRNNCATKDIPYQIVEKKFLKFPRHFGWGIKKWPTK
jgi:hypothetical protein